jgi:methylated-DNA-[protein]-cysteine S-methyltransferase
MLGKTIDTPLGPVRLVASDGALAGVYLPAQEARRADDGDDPILAQAARELSEYFAGERTRFDVPLRARGTAFQARVWALLRAIPYGATRSYGELARSIDSAARAVGGANAKNPLSIVVPCHRVVGARGDLVGYAGGAAAKRWLLEHERTRS